MIFCAVAARFRNDNGNECVVYANLENRKLYLNWVENDWNSNDWFGSSKYLYLVTIPGRLFICLTHPPIIRPISSSCSEIAAYFLLSKAFISHAILRKNFMRSSLTPASKICSYFCSPLKCEALKVSSTAFRKAESIFAPSEYFEVLGKFARISCQNL